MLPEFENTEIAFRYRSSKELKQARFLFASMGSPTLTKIGITFTKIAMAIKLPINGLIKRTIFKQFCGGETLEEAAQTAAMLNDYKVGVILDYGVEGKEGEQEFDQAVPEFLKAIDFASSQKNISFISLKVTGFSRFALLEKLHNNEELSPDEQAEWQRVQNRIDIICAKANARDIKVLVDAEESWIQNPIDELTDSMMEKHNTQNAVVYNTFQLYLHSRLPFLIISYERARQKGYHLGAKLVRGAYMEKERARAIEKNYPSPVQPDKEHSDKDYDEAVDFCIEHLDNLGLFIGTHNEKSCMHAAKKMMEKQIDFKHPNIYFSQLFGMSDNISFNLAIQGFHIAKYLPYGPVSDVMPYLMRRAQENTSVAGQTGRELGLINTELKRRKLL
jgi:proline dehydrogenase